MRRLLAIVLLSFILVACQGAGEQESDRNYDGVFDGLKIHSRYVEKIKLFDRMAFADGQDKYVSASLTSTITKGRHQTIYTAKVYYTGTFQKLPDYLVGNLGVMHRGVFAPYPYQTFSMEDAGLIIVGVDTPDEIPLPDTEVTSVISIEGVPVQLEMEDLEYLDERKCALFRSEEAFTVKKTVAIVFDSAALDQSRENQRDIVSCVNRSYFMHFGFSNAPHLPAEVFATWSDGAKQYLMNHKFNINFPPFFRDGSMAGRSRFDVLRAYAEQVGKAK